MNIRYSGVVGTRHAKDALFEGFASVAKAMGNGHRAEIIDVLAQGERSVDEVATEIEQSVANTSHHLRLLAATGLLRSRRDGQRIVYSLAGDRVADLWAALRDVAIEHVAKVEVLASDYLGDRSGIETVTADQLAERVDHGQVVVLDVRSTLEYRAGHIPGARSIPMDELSDCTAGLPASGEIIAYCRGPYCVYADDAVRLLRSRGFTARRLRDGFPEWRRSGRGVEVTTDNQP